MKGKRGLVLIAIAVLVVAGVGMGAARLLGRQADEGQVAAAPRVVETVEVGRFVTNLSDPMRERFVEVTVQVEVEGEAAAAALAERQAVVRDRILYVLRSTRYEDLCGGEGMANLAETIRQALSGVVSAGPILNVYFTDFIIQ